MHTPANRIVLRGVYMHACSYVRSRHRSGCSNDRTMKHDEERFAIPQTRNQPGSRGQAGAVFFLWPGREAARSLDPYSTLEALVRQRQTRELYSLAWMHMQRVRAEMRYVSKCMRLWVTMTGIGSAGSSVPRRCP